ncbi:cupin domain-containing protein [Ruegeria pomeroyi]|nr:cupin domain-containing protein [Ruegeria pomeroyi]
MEEQLEVRIGDAHYTLGPGDTVHCPSGVSHYPKNVRETQVKLIRWFSPGELGRNVPAKQGRQT